MLPSRPRVLAIRPGPGFSVIDVHDGWVDGLRRAGAFVADWNLDDRAEFLSRAMFQQEDGTYRKAVTDDVAVRMAVKSVWEACYEIWPHVVLVTSGFWIPPAMLELMRRRGHKVVLSFTESPYEDDKQLALAPYADLVLVNDPTNLDEFRQVNPNTVYQPHGWREQVHTPGRPTDAHRADVTFVGTGYPSRVQMLSDANWDGLRLLLAGNWHAAAGTPLERHVAPGLGTCVDNTVTVDLYRSARVGLNIYRKEHSHTADGWAVGPREVEMAAIGLPFVREPRGESDLLFPNHPTFDSPLELSDAARRLLADDRLRDDLARKGRAAVADRSYTHHAAALLRQVDNLDQGAVA